jgi:hypothetical protein
MVIPLAWWPAESVFNLVRAIGKPAVRAESLQGDQLQGRVVS